MNRLDGDNGLFNSKGQKARRDIVQFVPFREVKYNPDYLAKQLLAELPDQVVQYFLGMNSPPRQPPPQQNIEAMMGANQQELAKNQLTNMFEKADFFNAPNNNNNGQNPYGNS